MSTPSDPRFRPLPDDADVAPVDAVGEPLDPADDTSPQGARGRRAFRESLRTPLVALGAFAALGLGVFVATGGDVGAAAPTSAPPQGAAEAAVVPLDPNDPFTFSGLDIHPDRLFAQYFAGAFAGAAVGADVSTSHLADFRWRLDMYQKAYGVDDNFTVRVLDNRTGETLEVAQLRGDRDRFRGSGQADWDQVNRARRTLTTDLRKKWTDYGVPRSALVIRWGYADQTREARERDAPYLAYEVNLARRLGLSLLPTEIGTVETFNQDQLISSAGAQSRFQLMPDIMGMFGVEQYALPVASGGAVQVREQRHPLLAMEPSLMLVRAYANAVGHELPGVSAYHTGPGNIFKLYREYLKANPGQVRGAHVSDAYMWGVTDGFEQVDEVSSFGPHSRAYVLKAYGSLRATEGDLVQPEQSFRGELVRLRPGAMARLSQVLDALAPHERRLTWGPVEGATMYAKFRALNPHIALPAPRGDGVPAAGDLRLSSSADGEPVRFFLPIGSASVLRRVGLDVVGDVQAFDETTFLIDPSEVTSVDRAYTQLVREAGDFGFTSSIQRRMDRIHDQLQALAEQNPDSRYRQTQAKVARIHRSVWRTKNFRNLVATTETLLAADPRVNLGRGEIPSATPPLRRPTMEPLPPRPPQLAPLVP
ncbi:hypothetical protein RQM47_09840 [Rubrivirga sp. S365]|uniref:Transglycosylase SLT domain-containing protein n=1 Tax=Rubrivirga litoralis TaxID=3075598 RepID=A0ABU3BTZ6_9BACT|nr:MULTISPECIES: hypothetical protein [unclassified Rubrivirga]MDT0632755.1 hypothetical protein [Rubrivirga sp. F394]MDT7856940.1 hypothetical protein [Rubrivirga sp. S365]